MKKHWIKKCCMILTCLYLTGCGREEVPYLDTTQTQEQTVETERTEQNEVLNPDEIDINRIFEKFYKADAARSKTSTGLGMAIAKEMTECMGGKISASLHDNIFIVNIEFKKA